MLVTPMRMFIQKHKITPSTPKNLLKTQENSNLLKTKRGLNTKINDKLDCGFCI